MHMFLKFLIVVGTLLMCISLAFASEHQFTDAEELLFVRCFYADLDKAMLLSQLPVVGCIKSTSRQIETNLKLTNLDNFKQW